MGRLLLKSAGKGRKSLDGVRECEIDWDYDRLSKVEERRKGDLEGRWRKGYVNGDRCAII